MRAEDRRDAAHLVGAGDESAECIPIGRVECEGVRVAAECSGEAGDFVKRGIERRRWQHGERGGDHRRLAHRHGESALHNARAGVAATGASRELHGVSQPGDFAQFVQFRGE